jgi:sugar/nucleoside kinase (ribokinase family)
MKLQIAGGTYLEKCLFPEWHELFGSGLRGALAVKALGGDVVYHTYVGPESLPTLESRTAEAGIELRCNQTPGTVSFDYTHGLSTPLIGPTPNFIKKNPPLNIKGDAILRFGFMEGDAVVAGDRVVYDPQNPYNPDAFSTNESVANELAIVCNRAEGFLLTGEKEPERIAEALREKESCAVAVIKCGSHGCVIAGKDDVIQIPAFKTNHVWPIGSGDVFASVFAKIWAVDRQSPQEAARMASLATAFYCESMTLDFGSAAFNAFNPDPFHPNKNRKSALIYLAGPFFSMSQNWLIEESFYALQSQHLDVFSPLHHVGRGSATEVYPADIGGLDKCDLVFACVDGLDSGTIFEIGYAVAKGKKVVAFVQNETPEDLKMLEGARCLLERDFVTAIYKTYWLAKE